MTPGARKTVWSSPSGEPWLVTLCRLLNRERAQYLVVGAQACQLHGLIRATGDFDLLIPKEVKNAARILKALGSLTFGIARELDAVEVAEKPITIVGDTPRVDLMTVAGQVNFRQANKRGLVARIQGVKIPYVDLETLIETKKTGRLQDRADVERLLKMTRKKRPSS